MDDLWNVAFTICGLGAIGAFVFFSLYKQWLALPIFPKLTKKQAFILFLVFLSLTFCGLIALLITYLVTEQRQETIGEQNVRIEEQQVRIDDLVTGREELQEALNQANRQSKQLALGMAETRGQALAVANEDPTVKMLAAKLQTTLDQFKEQTNLNELSELDDLQVRLTEATLANAERQYARSLKLVTEDDALTEQLATEAQIEREVSVQRVRGHALHGQGVVTR